jgi:1,4-alpha-glucan branching enzyme
MSDRKRQRTVRMSIKQSIPLCAVAGLLAAACPAGWAADEEIATTFKYTNPTASKVEVAGEFSNWKTVPMTKDAAGVWTKTIYLKPGQYGYKFIVNGSEWVFDPDNPARKTINDIENSAITVGGARPMPAGGAPAAGKIAVALSYTDPAAKTVHLAGEFNNWLDNDQGRVTGHPDWMLQPDGAGNWKITAHLPPGTQKFKYVVDGSRWETDPKYPTAADGNSVIEVKADAGSPAPAAAPTGGAVAFSYADPGANSVSVAGEFNNWNTTANPMQKDAFGIWTVTIPLKPGRYQYKFVVNGTDWKLDPVNPEKTTDAAGNENSLKIVTP